MVSSATSVPRASTAAANTPPAFDFGELVVVADEDHAGADVAGAGDHAVQVDGAGHRLLRR